MNKLPVQKIQKKPTPWTAMMTDRDLMFDDRKSVTRTQAHPGLVVAASPIDKAPNLGGLSCTCRILGVGALVIGSKNIVKDKEFFTVSVTSEHWVPLVECPLHRLGPWLLEKRTESFRIVAVKQTANSVCLDSFTFPARCVLLLGKEKEGVPVELLDLVDDCVEIPQHGLIRSLNLHVTGARWSGNTSTNIGQLSFEISSLFYQLFFPDDDYIEKSVFDRQKEDALVGVDLSRKGSIDQPIVGLTEVINIHRDTFTLSSCSEEDHSFEDQREVPKDIMSDTNYKNFNNWDLS